MTFSPKNFKEMFEKNLNEEYKTLEEEEDAYFMELGTVIEKYPIYHPHR